MPNVADLPFTLISLRAEADNAQSFLAHNACLSNAERQEIADRITVNLLRDECRLFNVELLEHAA